MCKSMFDYMSNERDILSIFKYFKNSDISINTISKCVVKIYELDWSRMHFDVYSNAGAVFDTHYFDDNENAIIESYALYSDGTIDHYKAIYDEYFKKELKVLIDTTCSMEDFIQE